MYQMDQGSGTHPEGGTAFYEPGRGQLHTEPHTRPISCHVTTLSCQEPEEQLDKLLLTKVSECRGSLRSVFAIVIDVIFHINYLSIVFSFC